MHSVSHTKVTTTGSHGVTLDVWRLAREANIRTLGIHMNISGEAKVAGHIHLARLI